MVWVVVAMLGIVGVPGFIERRIDEYRYVKREGGTLRWFLVKSRISRTILLSLGIFLCVAVAIVAALPLPDSLTRIVSVVMLIGVEMCMVATLWSDQYWARQIDQAPSRDEARMDAQDRRMDADDVRMDDIERTARGHAGQEHHTEHE